MKYLKSYKIYEYESNDIDILEELNLWDINYSWNDYDFLHLNFEYPDRVDKYEIDTISKVLKRLKPLKLTFSAQKISSLKNLKLNDELIYLDCSFMNISELPELPKNLERLNCSNNKLTYLPELPKNLKELYCKSNKLTYLPELPESLILLDIRYNNINVLPKLPEIEDLKW